MSKLIHILVTICLLAFWVQAVEAKEYTFELGWHDQNFAWSERFILNVADVASLPINIESKRVLKGRVNLSHKSGDAIEIIWDKDNHMLYADLNNDGVFTDDLSEKFLVGPDSSFENFRSFTTATIDGRKYQLEFRLNDDEQRDRYCRIIIQSCYAGMIELDGKKWFCSIVDIPDGKIGRDDKINFTIYGCPHTSVLQYISNSKDVSRYEASEEIFIGSKLYGMSYSYAGDSDDQKLLLTMQEKQIETGSLDITGRLLDNLFLLVRTPGGSEFSVWPDLSEDLLELPVGDYLFYSFILRNETGVKIRPIGLRKREPFAIAANETTLFKYGGPLNNEVKVEMQGGFITLDYDIVGAGGESYVNLNLLSRDNVPTFAVYKNGRKIFSDTFEYG